MKKYLCGLFAFILCLGVFCGCQKETLPLPKYPLDTANLAAALQEAELAWTIVEEEIWPQGQIVHTLHDQDGKLVAFILSGMKDERRILKVSCMPYYDNATLTRSLAEEEWERVIVFATFLYGGFESERQVYNRFAKEYDAKNTVKKTYEKRLGGTVGIEEVAWWESEIKGINCGVVIERSYASMPQLYLGAIQFDNADADTLQDEKEASGPGD